MRTAEIEINGKKHLLCFNLWALIECTERYGSLMGIDEAIKSEDEIKAINETLWLLRTLMRGGEMYASESGIEVEKPIATDQVKALCSAADIVKLKTKVLAAINAGMSTSIEVESSKNVETTQV